ncbi:MAG: alginate export family protein [Gemmataceae bacterium]|nr:alginate export family protein [Gemmataceae bacterium]MCI0742993.1 alginate export family protein [Gemmataceae bacterium]
MTALRTQARHCFTLCFLFYFGTVGSAAQAPTSEAGQPTPDESQNVAECCHGFDFSKVPPVRVFPRLGFSPNLPSGPGYYSLRDMLIGDYREGPPKFPYAPISPNAFPFYDADFRYLDSPKNTQHDWADVLHRMRVGDNWLFATGGEFRFRYMHEINSRLSGQSNDYNLIRTRIYGDLWFQDRVRVYTEFLDARSHHQELAPQAVDVDRADLLNAFVDVKLGELAGYPAYVRLGRQELMLGSQRLVSPLDWVNTRRTFNGIRGFRQGEKWDVDLFWLQPVLPDPSNFDSIDDEQNFAGAWITHRPDKGVFRDFYYLYLDNNNAVTQLAGPRALVRAPSTTHTIGTRWFGNRGRWLYDAEGMVQLGQRGPQDIVAGAGTVGGGYHFAQLPMNPVFWVYYDYASGDRSPNAGAEYNTFNQLFSFGHYYMGWIDLVARQNIHDFNLHLYLYPTKWITFWTQYHMFHLDSRFDALYNASGAAIRRDPTGRAGTDVGNELDLFLNFHLSPHQDILVGYSKLFAGDFIRGTRPGQSPELFYVQYSFRW